MCRPKALAETFAKVSFFPPARNCFTQTDARPHSSFGEERDGCITCRSIPGRPADLGIGWDRQKPLQTICSNHVAHPA